jgi:K+-sensing histidine kinase KdpD
MRVALKKSHWQRVFDDFYRDTSSRSKQGTGIGLSLCKQILLIHNSAIAIKESNKRGTTWEVTLQGNSLQDGEVYS